MVTKIFRVDFYSLNFSTFEDIGSRHSMDWLFDSGSYNQFKFHHLLQNW